MAGVENGVTKLPTAAVPSPRSVGQAGPRAADHPPIFQALADHWRAAGRLVPGEYDPDWARLTREAPWPGRWCPDPRPAEDRVR